MLRPEILCHPNIPKPLHEVAPRNIMGPEWWDNTRREAYKSTDYHCCACGVHKSNAKKHKWLEAHEYWEIDYETGVCEITDIVALCHYCHNFIHSGRLQMIVGKEKTKTEVIDILEHGFKILSNNKLLAFPGTLKLAIALNAKTFKVKAYELHTNPKLKWNDFKLIFEGKEYKSNFQSYDEWRDHYRK